MLGHKIDKKAWLFQGAKKPGSGAQLWAGRREAGQLLPATSWEWAGGARLSGSAPHIAPVQLVEVLLRKVHTTDRRRVVWTSATTVIASMLSWPVAVSWLKSVVQTCPE